MSHDAGQWLKFHADLWTADQVAAEWVRCQGCGRCGGRLDVAHYPRKGRGLNEEGERAGCYDLRLSFCCAREGCRRRATPPSVRFLGRHVFVAAMVLWTMSASAAARAPTPAPARQTRTRWRSFWQEHLLSSALFVAMIGSRMGTPLEPREMPDALLERCAGDGFDRALGMLRLLAPWTTATVPPEQARCAMAA